MKIKLCIGLFYILNFMSAFAQDVTWGDSIRSVLSMMSDTSRLSYLEQKMEENDQNVSRLDYARLLYAEAQHQQNEEYIANAMFTFARHFYLQNTDSLRYWAAKAEPLLLKLGRKEDICRIKAWDIYQLNRENRTDKVVQAVAELKHFSDSIDFPEGKEMADQAMADCYFNSKMPEDGERLYLDVLERMKKRGAPLVKSFNILRQLMIKMPDAEERLKYTRMAEECLEECKKKGITQLTNTPIYAMEYVVSRATAIIYSTLGRFDEAWVYVQKTDSIATKHKMARSALELDHLYSFYYDKKGDYVNGLLYVDKVIDGYRARGDIASLYSRLQDKAGMLDKSGQYKEAYELSIQLLSMKDSINSSDFNQTLAGVRTEYEVEKLELEKQRIEEQAKQTRQRLLILIGGCVLLLIVVIGLIRIIRVIQQNRKELKAAKEKAEEADMLKSAFLANMNHEIRTPLNAIVGFSQVLIDEEDREIRKEFAGIIQNNNELLQRLIADVLDISKIESNSISLIYTMQNLPPLMKEIYNVILLRMPDCVQLVLDPCEPFILETDRNRLVQILTNLLTNAVKHTAEGQIRFGYEIQENDIQFYVKDTGEGISDDQLESIFDRFVQLASGRKGVGLGLAICKGLVSKMGGSIWVTSKLGLGSTFYMKVPRKRPVRIGRIK